MNIVTPAHHPVFDSFSFKLHDQTPGWQVDGLGIRTRESFSDQSDWNVKFLPTEKPDFNEAYFEWIDVLTAVLNAQKHFRMIEVGAGYGPWLTVAGVALKQLSQMRFQLIGIEVEPNRFRWMKQHFLDNGIELKGHCFYNGVVNASGGAVWFDVGDSDKSYGATILRGKNIPTLLTHGLRGWLSFLIQRRRLRRIGAIRPERVKAYRFSKILKKYPKIDIVDMDIQGAEGEVVRESISELNQKVKMIHIGTHNDDVEDQLLKLFINNGWKNLWNFKNGEVQSTPYGYIKFSDGVQTWVNPHI
jgi:FkbM family methyltransferase